MHYGGRKADDCGYGSVWLILGVQGRGQQAVVRGGDVGYIVGYGDVLV